MVTIPGKVRRKLMFVRQGFFDPLTSVTAQDMQRSGVQDYFKFSAAIAAEADKRFDYILKLMEAMQ